MPRQGRRRTKAVPTRYLHVLLDKVTRSPYAYYETARDARDAWKTLTLHGKQLELPRKVVA